MHPAGTLLVINRTRQISTYRGSVVTSLGEMGGSHDLLVEMVTPGPGCSRPRGDRFYWPAEGLIPAAPDLTDREAVEQWLVAD